MIAGMTLMTRTSRKLCGISPYHTVKDNISAQPSWHARLSVRGALHRPSQHQCNRFGEKP